MVRTGKVKANRAFILLNVDSREHLAVHQSLLQALFVP